ncbi:hypothetical protein PR048_008952 [Dryococelus australis]|uniref:Uncharacterized protein n=1 Tax=Dryococelus australis TaxID=614101 RepID=A0ABQ9HYJ5_9NEOP|nr:hypothetical protein PR048_008952 [Dryococelus australis]
MEGLMENAAQSGDSHHVADPGFRLAMVPHLRKSMHGPKQGVALHVFRLQAHCRLVTIFARVGKELLDVTPFMNPKLVPPWNMYKLTDDGNLRILSNVGIIRLQQPPRIQGQATNTPCRDCASAENPAINGQRPQRDTKLRVARCKVRERVTTRGPGVMGLEPVVEPACPELHDPAGLVRLERLELAELRLGATAEVGRHHHCSSHRARRILLAARQSANNCKTVAARGGVSILTSFQVTTLATHSGCVGSELERRDTIAVHQPLDLRQVRVVLHRHVGVLVLDLHTSSYRSITHTKYQCYPQLPSLPTTTCYYLRPSMTNCDYPRLLVISFDYPSLLATTLDYPRLPSDYLRLLANTCEYLGKAAMSTQPPRVCSAISWQLTTLKKTRCILRRFVTMRQSSVGLTVAERLACSPLTKVIRVQFPAESLPDFRKWESGWTIPLVGGFSQRYSVCQPLQSDAASFSPHPTVINSHDVIVKSSPNLAT